MRRYLLDTAPLAALLHGRPGAVELIRPWLTRHEAATSLLVYGEVVEYLMGRTDRTARREALHVLLRDVYPYFLTFSVLDRYAALRRELRSPYGSGLIGDIDTLIAATALEHDLTVVTTDRDFLRVPELHVRLLAPRTFMPIDPKEA